jgi:DNA-binding MarR family transcriptional regulator
MYLIRRRRGDAFRRAALARLTQDQREQFTRFINKATGWFTVALGATLLAAEQTCLPLSP